MIRKGVLDRFKRGGAGVGQCCLVSDFTRSGDLPISPCRDRPDRNPICTGTDRFRAQTSEDHLRARDFVPEWEEAGCEVGETTRVAITGVFDFANIMLENRRLEEKQFLE